MLLISVACSLAQFPSQPDVAALKLRAEAGDLSAQDTLAESYLGSFYHADAAKWFRLAAEKGVTNAQWRLGQVLVQGKPAFPRRSPKVEADPAQGARWLKKAAINGHARAQSDLARCYEQGLGVSKDNAEAFKWYTLAARKDGIVAKTYRDQLALKLSTKDISEGQRRADSFIIGAQPSVWEGVLLKGISGRGQRRFVLINEATVTVGEQFTLRLDGSRVGVRCDAIRDSSVVLSIGADTRELFLGH